MTEPSTITARRVKVEGDLFHPRIPEGAVYVGRHAPGLRRSPFHNPHRVDKPCKVPACAGATHDLDTAVALFREHLDASPGLRARLPEIAGRDLACRCPLPEDGEPDRCHAAVLIRYANSESGAL